MIEGPTMNTLKAEVDFLSAELTSERTVNRTLAATVRKQEADLKAADAEIARLTAMLTPKPLDNSAPKDRDLIGVDRPPYEDRNYYRIIEWREDKQQWMTQCGVNWETKQYIWAFCNVTHYLDPLELPGLPYWENDDVDDDWNDEEEQP